MAGVQITSVEREALMRSAGMGTLTRAEWDGFLLFARAQSLLPGEALFTEGAQGDSMAIVLEGSLSVRLRAATGEREIGRSLPGEFIGEMACLDPAPRAASVVALTPTRVVTLDRSALLVMSEHLPRVAALLTGVIIQRVNARLEQIDLQLEGILSAASPPPPESEATQGATPEATAPRGWWNSLVDRVRGAA